MIGSLERAKHLMVDAVDGKTVPTLDEFIREAVVRKVERVEISCQVSQAYESQEGKEEMELVFRPVLNITGISKQRGHI